MTKLSVEEKINAYLKKNPDLKALGHDAVVSIMIKNGDLTMTEAQRVSAFAKTETVSDDKGTIVERSVKTDTPVQVKQTEMTQNQAKDASIEYLSENLQSAIDICRKSDNGIVSEGYDAVKNLFKTELSSKNVGDVLAKEHDSIGFLVKARDGELTKREYYEQNKARLKDMIMNRFNRKDDTGITYLDKLRGNYSEKEFTKILDDYITHTTDTISTMKGVKDAQHSLIMMGDEEAEAFLSQAAEHAKKEKADEFTLEGQKTKLLSPALEKHPFDSEELMTFEETFELERGTKFDKKAFEELQQSKGEMNFATGAHNKTQELRNNAKLFIDEYTKAITVHVNADGSTYSGEEPLASERADKISGFYTEYYKASPENAKKDLNSIIIKQQLDLKINQDENGALKIDFGGLYKTDAQKNRALNTLLKVSVQEQENKLTQILGGKTYESYLESYQRDYTNALGKQNADELAKAMQDDQLTVVQKYTGLASMGGMAVMVAGGILTLTPASPLGMGMVAAGGKVAMAGMAAKNILGFTEELSRDKVSDDRMTRLKKDLALDIGGLIVGGAAGRQGLKFASQIIQKGGNKALAVLAEKGTDFTLSVAGDLAMIGALNYDEGLTETLKNNGIGIIVSTITGIKASKEMFKGEFEPQTRTARVEQNETVQHRTKVDETLSPALKQIFGEGAPEAHSINAKIGKDNLPGFNKLIGTMREKYGDDSFVQKLIIGLAGNDSVKINKNYLENLKKLVSQFEDTPENRQQMMGLVWMMDNNNAQAMHNILKMSNRDNKRSFPWKNIESLTDACYMFKDKKSVKALEQALIMKNSSGEYIYKTDEIKKIVEQKDLILCNSYTNKEKNFLKYFIKELSNYDDTQSIIKVLTSSDNKDLQAQIKDILKKNQSITAINDFRKLKPQVDEKICYLIINDIKDKNLKSLIKRNINKINPKDRKTYVSLMSRYLTDLSNVKDKYIMGQIYRRASKIAETMNQGKKVDLKDYAAIKKYIDIDKEFQGENVYSYGNATEYIKYMEREYPQQVNIFKDLAEKYETLSPEEYKNYLKNNPYANKISDEFIAAVPNYVKDKKIQELKKYLREHYSDEKDINLSRKDKDAIKHLYKEKYLTLLPEAARERCEKIYDSFGVKVFLSNENDLKSLDFIYNELLEWQKAGKGEAVMPPTIDLSLIKQGYIDKIFQSGGFHEHDSHNLSLPGSDLSNIQYAIRHEITHANDKLNAVIDGIITHVGKDGIKEEINIDEIIVHKTVQKYDENGNPMFNSDGTPVLAKVYADNGTLAPDMDKCKYVDEFKNAGIPEWHIPYAYTKKAEFVAVASEGDYSKYSKEFKELLVKLGLPKWIFNMKPKADVTPHANLYTNEKFSKKYTPEENQRISVHTEDFYNWVVKNKDDIKNDYTDCFGNIPGGTLQTRVKDLQGLNEKIYREIDRIDKKIAGYSDIEKYNAEQLKKGDEPLTQEAADILIENKLLEKQKLINDYETVCNTIQDSYGARLVMNDTSPAAIAKVHRSLLNAIDSGEIKILEINNYQGDGSIPYFSSAQIKQLQTHCSRQGYTLKVISDINAPKGKESLYKKDYDSAKAIKASGYTTCQMNIQHKSGVISEFQIRGKYINELAESEHIFYDISQNKDLSKGNPQIKQITDPLVKVVEEMNAKGNEDIKKAYSKYLTECYKYARMQELGIPMNKPKLPEKVNPMLDIDNIIAIHEKIETIK